MEIPRAATNFDFVFKHGQQLLLCDGFAQDIVEGQRLETGQAVLDEKQQQTKSFVSATIVDDFIDERGTVVRVKRRVPIGVLQDGT